MLIAYKHLIGNVVNFFIVTYLPNMSAAHSILDDMEYNMTDIVLT